MKIQPRTDWFLIESWPGLMLTAKVEIVAREVEFLLPLTWRRMKVDGRDQPHPTPRLPGNYAFVALPNDPMDQEIVNEQAAAIAGLRGVRRVFKNARGTYQATPKREIQALREIEAEEHREAGKARPKFAEQRFKPGAKVRILRHATFEGHTGEFLYSVRGQATLAMENGIRVPLPDCDIAEVGESLRRAG
jgi:hypothetical protein